MPYNRQYNRSDRHAIHAIRDIIRRLFLIRPSIVSEQAGSDIDQIINTDLPDLMDSLGSRPDRHDRSDQSDYGGDHVQ